MYSATMSRFELSQMKPQNVVLSYPLLKTFLSKIFTFLTQIIFVFSERQLVSLVLVGFLFEDM